MWGAKESFNLFNHFYIYNRWTSRSNCLPRWLSAAGGASDCTATSALSLTEWYGNESLWNLIPQDTPSVYLNSPAPTAWDGNPYTWMGNYNLVSAFRSGLGTGVPCNLNYLGVVSGALNWLDPKAATTTALNSRWNLDHLNPLLFLQKPEI